MRKSLAWIDIQIWTILRSRSMKMESHSRSDLQITHGRVRIFCARMKSIYPRQSYINIKLFMSDCFSPTAYSGHRN